MVERVKPADVSSIKTELDQALSTLDIALLEAGRSLAVVRDHMAQVVELAERSREMEAAMTRAREQLTLSFENGGASPPPRAIPAPAPVEEIEPPVMEPDDQRSHGSGEAAPVAVEEPDAIPAHDQSAEASSCLRLTVSSNSGNLDLKEVDSSVNENPSVIDVALLDYDGRQATLKLWINDSADPDGVRDALLASLRNHLGAKDIELSIEFEEDSTA